MRSSVGALRRGVAAAQYGHGQGGDPVDGPSEGLGGRSPGPLLRAKSAKVSAVVYLAR